MGLGPYNLTWTQHNGTVAQWDWDITQRDLDTTQRDCGTMGQGHNTAGTVARWNSWNTEAVTPFPPPVCCMD